MIKTINVINMKKDTIELISNEKHISFKAFNMKPKDINEREDIMKIRANQIFDFFSGEVCIGIFNALKELFYEQKLDELHNCDLSISDNKPLTKCST